MSTPREQYAAVVNADKPVAAALGLAATYRIGSDKYAGTITAISKTGHKLTWTRREGTTATTPRNWTQEFTRRRDGSYGAKGSKCGDLVVGAGYTSLDQGF